MELRATPDEGAEGDIDAALGGRTFQYWFAELPSPLAVPFLSSPGGNSSIVRFTPLYGVVGHYTLVARRSLGGLVIIHLDRDPSP